MILFWSVRNQPGAKQFTVMPCLPQSSARLMVSWRMPPRLAPYGPRPAKPATLVTEPTLMMRP